jgi:hypothetical protein
MLDWYSVIVLYWSNKNLYSIEYNASDIDMLLSKNATDM